MEVVALVGAGHEVQGRYGEDDPNDKAFEISHSVDIFMMCE